MTNDSLDGIVIQPAGDKHRSAAVRILASRQFTDHQAGERSLHRALGRTTGGGDGLFVAARHGRVIGAAWGQPLAGGSVALWGPAPCAEAPSSIAQALLAAVISFTRESDRTLLHALVPTDEFALMTVLQSSRLVDAGKVDFLVCSREHFPTFRPELPFELHACHDQELDGLIDITEATYQDSLDCPVLTRHRGAWEVVQMCCDDDSEREWFVARVGGEPIGCLLLGRNSWEEVLELQYMGLIPRVRGRGWGRALVQQTLWMARQLNCLQVELALDRQNWPAERIYVKLGFTVYDERHLWICLLQ